MRVYVFVGVVTASCGACASETNASRAQTTNLANPCATKGATYQFHAVEQSGGTCGPLADEIININADGTLPGPPLTCEIIRQDGCTARNTNCTSTTADGVTCVGTTSVTFASDGASATGLITQRCSNASASCTSTYAVTATRK